MSKKLTEPGSILWPFSTMGMRFQMQSTNVLKITRTNVDVFHFLHSVQGWCALILFKCDVEHFRKSVLISCFLKSGSTIKTNFKHHFQIFVAFSCIANTITSSNMHIRFIALNLGTPTDFGKGTFFRHLVVTLYHNLATF